MSINQSTLGARLKEARSKADLSQEYVAAALGLPETAVLEIEAGTRSISTLELTYLAQLYQRSIISFFTETLHQEEDRSGSQLRPSSDGRPDMPSQPVVSRYLEILRAGVELERLLDRPPRVGPPHVLEVAERHKIEKQVMHLALEAYRQQVISQGKLRDLGALLGIPVRNLFELAESA